MFLMYAVNAVLIH